MFEKNQRLCWALANSLDEIIKHTHTNEEWDMYHQLRKSIKIIYGTELVLSRYGLSGEKLRHEPIIIRGETK